MSALRFALKRLAGAATGAVTATSTATPYNTLPSSIATAHSPYLYLRRWATSQANEVRLSPFFFITFF